MTATIETTPGIKSGGRGTAKSRKPAEKPQKGPAKPKTSGKSRPSPAEREVTWPSPVKPSLVLLPPKVRGARARRKAIRGATVMSVGLLGLTVLGYVSVAAASSVAQAGLEAEMGKTAAHEQVLAANKPVQDFYDGLTARREAAVAALEQDISNSAVIKAVDKANTVGATLASITRSADPATCPVVDPFSPSLAIGCLTISGTAPSIAAVGQLSAQMSKDTEMLSSPYITESSISDKDDTTSFKMTVGYTHQALSNKGAPFAGTDAAEDDTAPAPAAGTTQETQK